MQKASAPWSVRKQPETFCLNFSIRISRSAWLLSNGTLRSWRKRSTSPGYRRRRPSKFTAADCLSRPRLPWMRAAAGLSRSLRARSATRPPRAPRPVPASSQRAPFGHPASRPLASDLVSLAYPSLEGDLLDLWLSLDKRASNSAIRALNFSTHTNNEPISSSVCSCVNLEKSGSLSTK